MTEYSRPATLDDLKMLLRSLNAHGVEYFLIGGYALAAHGYPRATTDIDVVVPATRQAGRRVKDALMVLPIRPRRRSPSNGSRKARIFVWPTPLSWICC